MDDRLRIRYLEERLEAVTREKMEALAALDAALGLYSSSRLHREASPESLLEEAAPRIRAVVPFHSFGFYTVGEGFPSFVLAHAQPESAAPSWNGRRSSWWRTGPSPGPSSDAGRSGRPPPAREIGSASTSSRPPAGSWACSWG
jgi:hypothetical protein